jgi:excinuclease ABC subunit C
MSSSLNKITKNIPQSPGVYIFKDATGGILYIGKATNLKSRVGSYFNGNGNGENRPVRYAIDKIADIEIKETDSVLEALILESNLVKKYQPKYNVDLKDDKSFAYAAITKEKFPRVTILRKTDIDFKKLEAKNCLPRQAGKLKAVFGPYTSKKQLETAIKIIRKIFPYHSNKQPTEKGCLDYQIGLCPGPYAEAISKTDYLKNIRNIRMILDGKKRSLIGKLEKEMKEAARIHKYEKAAEVRNKIFALEHIRDIALISKDSDWEVLEANIRIEAYDISNISGKHAVGSMVVFKNDEAEKSQYRKFKIKTIEGSDDVGMMREVLVRRFNNNWPKPDLILLDGGQGHLNMGTEILKTFKLDIPLMAVAKGPDRKNLDLRFDKDSKLIQDMLKNKDLIKRAMDEAHRFAISYHKKIRKKNFI